MNYKKIVILMLVLMLVFSWVWVPACAEENDTAQPPTAVLTGCHGMDATTAYLGTQEIIDNKCAVILYEVNSDTLMYTANPDLKMYPSSLVKIVTTLLAVQKGNLQDVVTVNQAVLDTVSFYAAKVGLVDGEQITLSDLLYCMMVGSGNDAAAVIATYISGSQQAFVDEMNSYAADLGCTGTHFANVHGLHDEQQYTTARDMGRILVDALKNETFLEYFTTSHYSVPATNKAPDGHELATNNYLMNSETYYDPRVVGGRAGVTDAGTRCLATLAENDSMKLACVLMNASSTYDDKGNTIVHGGFKETSALLDAGFNGYQVRQVLYENQALKQCQVLNGTNDVILAAAASSYSVLPASVSASELSYRYSDETSQFSAPINVGQVLSTVQVWYGGLCVGEAQLIALNSVTETAKPIADNNQPGTSDNKTEKKQDITVWIIIISIIAVAILVLIAVRIARKMQTVSVQKRSNQYRRYRRRCR